MGFSKGIEVVNRDVFLLNCFSPNNRITFSEERKKERRTCNPEYSTQIQSSNYQRGVVHMAELHTKISRHEIKVTRKYQLSSKKVKKVKKKKYNFKNVTQLLNMIFCPKNSIIDFRKTFITQEWLVVESCPTPRCVAFLMLYRLV